MAAFTLAALRAVATHCHLAAWSFTDEQAAEGLAVIDRLRDLFPPPPAAVASVEPQPHLLQWLQLLPAELLSVVLSHLDTYDLARLAATCRPLWLNAPTPPPRPMPLQRPMGPVETELRRAAARGLHIGSSLPNGALSWVPYLLKSTLRDALRREAPLAASTEFSIFVDAEGCLSADLRQREYRSGGPPLGARLGDRCRPRRDPLHRPAHAAGAIDAGQAHRERRRKGQALPGT